MKGESDEEGQSDISSIFVLMGLGLILAQNSNGLIKIDFELACLRGLLEKKYSNDYDAGYSASALSNIHSISSSDLMHLLQIISNVTSIACGPSKPLTTLTHPCMSASASIILLPT